VAAPCLFVISGGEGVSGELLARTALAQFQPVTAPLVVLPRIQRPDQVRAAVERAAQANGIIVHTLVDAELRQALIQLAQAHDVVAIDLIGPLLARLATALGQPPRGQPGLYRQLRQAYFDRIAAIEFTVAHDDGSHPEGWGEADIVLVGVSRVGKTPLSMYLAVQGWRVANLPLLREVPPPAALFQLDRRRVVGLTIDPAHLVAYRQWRGRRLGLPGTTAYADLAALADEVQAARRLCHRAGFAVIDISDKPIEESAGEVILLVTGGHRPARPPPP
jgi:regulator of PEP synthase PpsR (kinase-PPPase family)